jgi:hypothetical protein
VFLASVSSPSKLNVFSVLSLMLSGESLCVTLILLPVVSSSINSKLIQSSPVGYAPNIAPPYSACLKGIVPGGSVLKDLSLPYKESI